MDTKQTDKQTDESPQPGLLAVLRDSAVPVIGAAAIALGIASVLELVNSTTSPGKRHHAQQTARESGIDDPLRSAPRFAVVIARGGGSLGVRDLRTGGAADVRILPPAGTRFAQVASAGNGSYIVSAQDAKQISFHRLKLNAGGWPQEFSALRRAAIPGGVPARTSAAVAAASEMTVSADGGQVAYALPQRGKRLIHVISVKTGERRTWSAAGSGRIGGLSWAGRTLAFVWYPVRATAGKAVEAAGQVRTLDTAAKGGDLRSSKVLMTLPKPGYAAVVTRDGRSVLIAGVAAGAAGAAETDADGRVRGSATFRGSPSPSATSSPANRTGHAARPVVPSASRIRTRAAVSGRTAKAWHVTVAAYSAATGRASKVLWQRTVRDDRAMRWLVADRAGTHLLAGTAGEVYADPAAQLKGFLASGYADVAW